MMDSDCEMDRMFAMRLRRQQLRARQQMTLRMNSEGEMKRLAADSYSPDKLAVTSSPILSMASCGGGSTPPLSNETRIIPPEEVPAPDEQFTESRNRACKKITFDIGDKSLTVNESPVSEAILEVSSLDITRHNENQYPVTPDKYATPLDLTENGSLSCPARLTGHARSPYVLADRFIPTRGGPAWQTNYSMEGQQSGGDHSRHDKQAYLSLLRNEILGAKIDSLKGAVDDLPQVASLERRNLFQYTSSTARDENSIGSVSPYSLSPVGPKSQKLLRSPRKCKRKIAKIPFKVLDAPELQDDYYLNLVDWSSQNTLSVGLGSCVYLWSASTSRVVRLCDLTREGNSVTSVSWNERGNLLAVGTHHGFVQVWDVAVSKQVNKLEGHTSRVGALAWNGDSLASGSRDRTILQRDVRTPSLVADMQLCCHRQEVCGLKWSPDNQYLASGGNDNRLCVWSCHSVSPIHTYTDHMAAVKALAWSPHHHGLLASGGGTADRHIRFWNTLTGQPMQAIDTGSQVCNLVWSKHSSELVSTHGYSQNQIVVWKYPSMTQVAKLTGHSYRVLYLAMSPDGEAIVSGAGDETLRFWKVFSKVRHQRENRSVLNLFSNIR